MVQELLTGHRATTPRVLIKNREAVAEALVSNSLASVEIVPA